MDIRKKTQFMTMTALLTAIAILIPIVMPFKIVIPPASYTLGSHIPIFIAMFLSPLMAGFVIIASSLGFLMAGYPPVIVLRAFSHIVFGILGALYLKKFPETLDKPKASWIFNFVLGGSCLPAGVVARRDRGKGSPHGRGRWDSLWPSIPNSKRLARCVLDK